MSVPLAYLGVILIWATTPLAVKVSNQEVNFLFGVTARMTLGAVICWAVVAALRIPLPLDRAARRTYAAAAVGIFGSMLATYWGAQYITSGMVSVVFGVTPLATGVMAAVWLGERSLAPLRVAGILLGFAGLCAVFLAGARMEAGAAQGIAAVSVAALIHSASAVWVKRIGARVHPVALNAGALAIVVPLCLITWALGDGEMPHMTGRALVAIGYLALLGTAVGFVLYFHLLRHMSAGALSLITLVTPVLALLIGHWANHEAIGAPVWVGTGCILAGLALYQWGPRLPMPRHALRARLYLGQEPAGGE